MRQEENAAGITYEETKLDQALEEITGQREGSESPEKKREKKQLQINTG